MQFMLNAKLSLNSLKRNNMQICSENHDEIVFEGGHHVRCPLCEALSKIEDLEKEVVRLEEELTKASEMSGEQ